MAILKIDRKEIEKMLKDSFKVENIEWLKDGSANIDVNVDDLRKNNNVFIEKHIVYRDVYPLVRPMYPTPYIWSVSSGMSITTKGDAKPMLMASYKQ